MINSGAFVLRFFLIVLIEMILLFIFSFLLKLRSLDFNEIFTESQYTGITPFEKIFKFSYQIIFLRLIFLELIFKLIIEKQFSKGGAIKERVFWLFLNVISIVLFTILLEGFYNNEANYFDTSNDAFWIRLSVISSVSFLCVLRLINIFIVSPKFHGNNVIDS